MNRWQRALLCAACGGWVALHLMLLWTAHQDLVCERPNRLGCPSAVWVVRGLASSGAVVLLPGAAVCGWLWHCGLSWSERGRRRRAAGMASCALGLAVLGVSGVGLGLWMAFGSGGFSRQANGDSVTLVALLAGASAMLALAWGVWHACRWARVGAVPALLWPLAAAVSLGGDAAGPLVLLFYAVPFFAVVFYFSAGTAVRR